MTTNKHFYRAFGMGITSDIEMKELTKSNQISDVSIMRADLIDEWFHIKPGNRRFLVSEEELFFEIKNVGVFRVRGGQTILYDPFPMIENRQLKLFLLGTCMGAILMQRKVLPLHGSAVIIGGLAYAVVGESGAGKSTLARALMKRGYKLISDDILPIQFKEGVPYITSSYAQQKLWVESLDLFKMDTEPYESIMARETKYNVPAGHHFYDGEVELAGIFELSKSERTDITLIEINGLQTFPVLFQHTYRKSFLERMGLTEWHFNVTAQLAASVQIYKLNRPQHKITAEELADYVTKTAQKERSSYAKAK
ncbi:aldolase [Jeotgalibacillus aurantiacus]|uniref:aldolase n=1 Tax=Jeotgalibacillus aurantiacus TaxID=2763266 RepID=UPI001D0AEEE1|nr:aldolase [Jeotgalibacillus aurantiacus]